MKHVSCSERYEDDRGWLEIRLNCKTEEMITITGHWKAWDGETYHNTAPISKADTRELNEEQIHTLAYYAGGITNSPRREQVEICIRESVQRLLKISV